MACGFWNCNGWSLDSNSDNYFIKTSVLEHLKLNLIGLAETHLIGNSKVKMSGYTWFGQNMTSLHFRAKKGSCGVGFLVRNSHFNQFYINVCEDSYEGILWLELKDKQNSQILRACVCYLVPEFSTRNIKPQDYFDRLLCQIHVYQKDSDLMVFGDFNSRIGDPVWTIYRLEIQWTSKRILTAIYFWIFSYVLISVC